MGNVKYLIFILHLLALGVTVIFVTQPLLDLRSPSAEKVEIGQFKTRAIWTSVDLGGPKKLPAIVMIPGAGVHGPEMMVPGHRSANGTQYSFFKELFEPFHFAGVSTLMLGKPGVEYFQGWETNNRFYDRNLFLALRWTDLVRNVADAVSFLRAQKEVDTERIYLLAIADGGQVALDYARTDRKIAGLILLSYLGDDMATWMDWQLYQREIQNLIITDVDANRDRKISRSEFKNWSTQLSWTWKSPKKLASFSEIETFRRKNPRLNAIYENATYTPLHQGVFNRGPIHDLVASLSQDVYVLSGELDTEVPASHTVSLQEACRKHQKHNCYVEIFSGLGHGFSTPRLPRAHPLMDSTFGPVAPYIKLYLNRIAHRLHD